jgi:hypothetical protein
MQPKKLFFCLFRCMKYYKKISVTNSDGQIRTYNSYEEAIDELGIKKKTLQDYCNTEKEQTYGKYVGMKFKYFDVTPIYTETHKVCSKCKENKPHNKFHKDNTNAHNITSNCSDCRNKLREKSEDRAGLWKDGKKRCSMCNKYKHTDQYWKCSSNANGLAAKCIQCKKQYIKTITSTDTHKKWLSNYSKEKRKTNPYFAIMNCQRAILHNHLKSKTKRSHEYIGCTGKELKTHLELQFKPWMNWGNRGKYNGEYFHGWDMDHIRPLSSFDLTDPNQQLIAFSYKNIMPLCSRKNRYDKSGMLFSEWIEDKPFYFFNL